MTLNTAKLGVIYNIMRGTLNVFPATIEKYS